MAGSAVEDLEEQHGASAERVLPDHPDRRVARVPGKIIMWGRPAARQNGSPNRKATFS